MAPTNAAERFQTRRSTPGRDPGGLSRWRGGLRQALTAEWSARLLGLAAIVCIYNLPQLLSGSVQYDGLEVHYAAQRYLSDELHAGRVPFWTPFIFSGFPFLADLQVGAWYPLNWPFFLAGIVPRSIGLELLLHDLIACVGTFALAMRLIGRPLAAVVAAMLYGLSGWFATHSQHVGMVDTAAWLPWLMLLLVEAAERLSTARLLLAGLLGAAIALPGHFQVALYTFSFVGVWAVSEAIARRSWHVARRLLTVLVFAGVWGGALAAVMILPAVELVGQSERVQLNALALPDVGYFHPKSLLTLVYPNYYGLLSGPYVGPGDSTQHYFYAGILLVPLAVLGLRNARVRRTAAVLAVPFVWYALGPSGGLFRVVARLPGFRSVELPMHGWFLPALGLALLGGAGMLAVERRLGPRWSLGVVGLLLVDTLVFNQLLNPLAYARDSFEQAYGPPLAAFDVQVAAAQPSVERLYGPPLAEIGYRNHALQSRVETTYGYNPLELAAYAQYAAAAEANPRLVAGLAPSHRLVVGDPPTLQAFDGQLPLVTLVTNPIDLADSTDATAQLAELDPTSATLVVGSLPSAVAEADPSATVTVTARGLDWVQVHYTSRSPSLLRIAIPAYPGWQANLDGDAAPLPMVSVDRAFIGVEVPPGKGEVRLSYQPRVFWLGAGISALFLALTLGLAVLSVTRRARHT